ncbi:hypothetical protein HALLA_03865 (plasmid) [Halostagnicola larsenii XH-48]|uniref:Uncharacterized protein n=1 Tax=Halostagnicola larsenii XH-48 TaxID=797299 RepID=W0JWA7_9EURY|nr:hypothetical protein HALLA_03865 [Halostagnicola larsenii XH-48]
MSTNDKVRSNMLTRCKILTTLLTTDGLFRPARRALKSIWTPNSILGIAHLLGIMPLVMVQRAEY